MTRPRAGQLFTFTPVLGDLTMPEHYSATAGQKVRVVKLPGAPGPGVMGQCHIEDAKTGDFLGMVYCNSLSKGDES